MFLPQVNANGSVMSSDIVGSIKLKTMLSGMPELRLGLNDRVLFALTGRTCSSLVIAEFTLFYTITLVEFTQRGVYALSGKGGNVKGILPPVCLE